VSGRLPKNAARNKRSMVLETGDGKASAEARWDADGRENRSTRVKTKNTNVYKAILFPISYLAKLNPNT
jgi:hypothetical protein